MQAKSVWEKQLPWLKHCNIPNSVEPYVTCNLCTDDKSIYCLYKIQLIKSEYIEHVQRKHHLISNDLMVILKNYPDYIWECFAFDEVKKRMCCCFCAVDYKVYLIIRSSRNLFTKHLKEKHDITLEVIKKETNIVSLLLFL